MEPIGRALLCSVLYSPRRPRRVLDLEILSRDAFIGVIKSFGSCRLLSYFRVFESPCGRLYGKSCTTVR